MTGADLSSGTWIDTSSCAPRVNRSSSTAFAPRPARLSFRRFLVTGYRSLYRSGDTFFEDVHELPAATWLRIEANGERQQCRYWLYSMYPSQVRHWIADRGGLTPRTIFLSGRQLESMYRPCGLDAHASLGTAR